MRVTSKGQVTIPQEIRERFGFLPESEVEFRVEGNTVRLVKARAKPGAIAGITGRRRVWHPAPGAESAPAGPYGGHAARGSRSHEGTTP